jgi:hypothetical protein
MNPLKFFPKAFYLLKNFSFRTKKSNRLTNELTHPRFEITTANAVAEKKASNSLLFQMYSDENEALFI